MCNFNSNYVFWSDLAHYRNTHCSAHCLETVLNYLIENLINHDKADNPANFPECRPVEDFCFILKAKVYTNNLTAKDIPT